MADGIWTIPTTWTLLDDLVASEQPGLVFIDTVWRATRRRLNREDEVNAIMTPIVSIAQAMRRRDHGLDASLEGSETPLAAVSKGLARGIMKMFKPDPGQPDRRRLEVIGNFKEPPPLGVTIRDGGCDFDFTPPEEPAKSRVAGRPRNGRRLASSSVDALAQQNDRLATTLLR